MNTDNPAADSSDARSSALFHTLIAQQVNMAAICLGQAPDEQGQKHQDLEGARFFIDMLEMLAVKTKGNLATHEDHLLKQSLTSLRLAFVETAKTAPAGPSPSTPGPAPQPPSPESNPQAQDDPESRKKFTKKY
jgi:hypothetical protein